ncbi:MAG TPA: sigma-70 family RNA polymerase sigma factor [Novosphingobium sp.]
MSGVVSGFLSPSGADADEERALWQARDTGPAREALFARYLPVARRFAWRFMRETGQGVADFAELLQLASVGLLEAIDGYKPELGVPFRYYCTRRIRGAIAEGVGRLTEVNQQISTRRRIQRERLRALRTQGIEPRSLEEKLTLIGDIAAELAIGLMLEETAMFVREDECDPALDAYETLSWRQGVQHLLEALNGLPPRDAQVIRYHYLEGLPFDQIARLMALSKGRISQIHKAGVGLLRKRLSAMGQFRLEG